MSINDCFTGRGVYIIFVKVMKERLSNNKWFWIFSAFIVTFLNILGTRSSVINLNLALYFIQYAIILFYTAKNPTKGFLFYILFASCALEFDTFLYINEQAPFKRYTLFTSPSIFTITTVFLLLRLYTTRYHRGLLNKQTRLFLKGLIVMGVTGAISFGFAYLFNDNNMQTLPVYPDEFETQFRLFFLLVCTFLSTVILMQDELTASYIKDSSYSILVGLTAATVLSILMGFRGYYATEEIMMGPLVVCFSPCILLFINRSNKTKYFDLIVFLAILVLSISCPNTMGSKWYLIVFAVLLYFLWSRFQIKSKLLLVALVFVGLYFIPLLGTLLEGYFSSSGFSGHKLSQAVGMLDFFSTGSFESWFLSLDRSAQFRVDEPWNIFIEYNEKPMYMLFGKGFGGTITQHTPFLDWAGPGAFNDVQAGHGIYYNMHETLSNLFLRHGYFGLFFFVVVLYYLFKNMSNPWSLFAAMWFVFFWTYGVSFRLGAVALAIAFSDKSNRYGAN